MFASLYKKNISSDKLWRQVLGALLQWRAKSFFAFLFLVIPLTAGLSLLLSPGTYMPGILLLGLNLVLWLIIKVCGTLTNIFSLKRNDNGITTCQIIILVAFGLWLVGFALIFDIQNRGRVALVIAIIGVILGWIFQDRVKGIAAFISLRRHHLLNIGDWIQVPRLNADGEVKKVTLTAVTLYNWDTTTSTIPLSALQTEHFINLQHMAEGKTYGRRMIKNFTLDSGTVHPLSEEEAEHLKSADSPVTAFLPAEQIRSGALNARLYRLYLYHWLMNHPHISQKPTLLVRWLEPDKGGMAFQIYAFIIDSGLCAFEWQQSHIIEHAVTAMEWFGLRLYQAPAAFNVGNPVIHIDHSETVKKENKR